MFEGTLPLLQKRLNTTNLGSKVLGCYHRCWQRSENCKLVLVRSRDGFTTRRRLSDGWLFQRSGKRSLSSSGPKAQDVQKIILPRVSYTRGAFLCDIGGLEGEPFMIISTGIFDKEADSARSQTTVYRGRQYSWSSRVYDVASVASSHRVGQASLLIMI